MAVRITCVNKEGGYHQDPHHAISDLGWINEENGKNGKSTRLDMYDWIKNKNGIAYVLDRWGNKAYLVARESTHGTKYVRTIADNVLTDDLLSLPECVN